MSTVRHQLVSAMLLCFTIAPALQADEAIRATPALWEISDADTTISLFGTMHVMRPGVDWFNGEVRTAFDEADELVLEGLELAPVEQQRITMDLAIDKTGQALRSKLDDSERMRYENVMYSLGLPTNSFDAFEPWMAALTLSVIPMMQAGYQPDLGVESVLTKAAQASEKPMFGLEGLAEQLGFFDTLSESLQFDMLNGTVLGINEIRMMIHEMDTLWRSGRIDELGQMMLTTMTGYGDNDEFIAVLLTNRNKAWAEWVEQRMDQPGNVFMAVGAGHLAGDGNLRQLLEAKGYSVRRLRTKTALAD